MEGQETAVIVDETRRVLGDTWVNHLSSVNRTPDFTDGITRRRVREFLAEEIQQFDSRPYPNHPDYNGEHQPDTGVDRVEVSPSEVGEQVSEADRRVSCENRIGTAVRMPDGKICVSVFEVNNGTYFRLGRKMFDGVQFDAWVTEFVENPSLLHTDPTPSGSGEVLFDADASEPFTDDDIDSLRPVIIDEVNRVAGGEWVEKAKSFRGGHSISYADGYRETITDEEAASKSEYWPPTEQNIRDFARLQLSHSVKQMEEMFLDAHPDYDGFYDPSGVNQSDSEHFAEVLADAEIVVEVDGVFGVWKGLVNRRRENGSIDRGDYRVDQGDVLVSLYELREGREAPTQVRSWAISDVQKPQELIDRLRAEASKFADNQSTTQD